jgi:ElaB/YqjD/DUF883 family membrane-anchored ribosome-binding protein
MADSSHMPGNLKDKAKETAAAAGRAASEAKDAVKETATNLADKAREAASNLGARAKDVASSAAERTDDTLASVGQGMSSLAGTLRQSAPREGMMGSAAGAVADRLEASGRYLQEHGLEDMGEDLRSFVRQYPLGSVLAVFGLGFLMGSALRR